MTFNSTTQKEKMVDEEKEMAMFSKRFNKLMKMKKMRLEDLKEETWTKEKKKQW